MLLRSSMFNEDEFMQRMDLASELRKEMTGSILL